jgi:uncharacterized protein YciI
MKMFIGVSVYKVAPEQASEHVADHGDWVAQHYRANRFLVSGRCEPPTGGVIIGRAESLEEFRDLLNTDPLIQRGISAVSEIVQFNATPYPKRSDAFEAFAATVQVS